MTKEEIKEECQKAYEAVQGAKERLGYLRSICKHEDTYECLYGESLRTAYPSIVCNYCNEWITRSEKSFKEIEELNKK